MKSEADAIVERYARRSGADRYSFLRPEVWQAVQERQREMLKLFSRLGWHDLSQRRLLEVGSGTGGNLLELLRVGFMPENLLGVELLADRHEVARRLLPDGLMLWQGDATEFDGIAESSQDAVFQSTVFSSLLDDAFQERLAASMWRWVKPGGGVLWYDFTFDNPRNKDVRGVPLSRVRQLFPEGRIHSRRVTLAPPLSRAVVRVHPSLYTLFNALPVLRTHLLCWIAKD